MPPPPPNAAVPTFSPAAGTYTAAQDVSLSDTTSGASIYYTTNGSTPTTASALYSTPIAVSSTTTIEAIAVASGYANSDVASGAYTISEPAAATPSFSPAPGAYSSAQNVTLSDTTAGTSIYFTTDGSIPTSSSTLYATPITVSSTTTINAIAVASGFANSAVGTGTYSFPGSASTVSVVVSTHDQSELMAAQPSVSFTTSTADAGTNTITVDATQQYQPIEGFGAAFTDSAAYLLEEVAQPSALSGTLNDLFTRNGSGIGLSFMRNPMGASDIALSVYSFDDQPAGSTDPTLSDFSIAHDQAYILPLIVQAKNLNPQMKILANPWSPPGWMKNTDSMLGGGLLTADETAFANYFVKYIQAYQAAGVPLDYISLENEPLNNTTAYPSMGMDAGTELSVLRDYLLPALTANNISTKVLVYDHNWDTPSYPDTVLSDPTVLASAQVAGTAWHGYAGTPGAQQTVQNNFPAKGAWMTEHSGGTWIADQFTSDFLEITQVMRNSARAYVKWSLALNENLGPNLTQNAGLGGCDTCTPIVTVNSQTGAITKDIEYYTLGHYSKYVLPGAVRIGSSNTPAIASVAFQNPDGSTALIAFNDSSASQTFQVQWGTQLFSYTLPALAAATFTWSGTQSGIPTTSATAQTQGSSYSSENGLETESTGDSTGQYDLGYITQGAYASYKNVDFGSSVSQVSVREASGGGGGTLEFHLDSPTGALISTVTLPVTGGWQDWQTVTGTVSGATGVHTLYLVFTGSANGIANLNWFQFE
ncbi:MAG: chitobiase/beta-hexosaminidase C-terminal domain-containing protein [Silvibacterium sp.]